MYNQRRTPLVGYAADGFPIYYKYAYADARATSAIIEMKASYQLKTEATPEYPSGTYYYVITDDFPSIPRYFRGSPF